MNKYAIGTEVKIIKGSQIGKCGIVSRVTSFPWMEPEYEILFADNLFHMMFHESSLENLDENEYLIESPKTKNADGNIEIYRFGTREVVLTLTEDEYRKGLSNFRNSIIGIVTSDGITIKSINGQHPYERMLERLFNLNDVIEALKTSTPVAATEGMAYCKGNMRVIVSHQTGKLMTLTQ